MTVQISVRTADGIPIVGASVALNGGSPLTTDNNGGCSVEPTDATFVVKASMVNYSEQEINFVTAKDGTTTWDDPGTVVTSSNGQISAEVRLGRLTPAPTIATDQKKLDDGILKIPDSVKDTGSYVDPLQYTFTMEDGEYAFLFAGNRNFWSAPGPTLLGDPKAKGWGALNATSAAIEPRMQGRFTWLEWAPPRGTPSSLNRYLVGLWAPRSSAVPGSAPRDAIIFYTPNTSPSRGYLPDTPPYRGNYPYALNPVGTNSRKLAQRYVGLGLRYLFNEKFLTYQMLAAARDALLIVPIQPAEQWGILQNVEGMTRLIKEAILYEHRRGQRPDAEPALDTAPERRQGSLVVTTVERTYLPPPEIGTVATAGFSAGMAAVNSLIQSAAANKPTGARTWEKEKNDSYSATPTDFIASWREIWDLDGSANAIGQVGTWVRTLATWQRANGHYTNAQSDRIVRCYHTDYTGWSSSNVNDLSPIIGDPLPNSGSPGSTTSGPNASEREGTNGTAVWFAHTYLTGNGPPDSWNENGNPPDAPAFWTGIDPPKDIGSQSHQAVPLICFGHAAALSKLRKL